MESLKWKKAARSGSNGEMCVEIARASRGRVAARDSKNPAGGMLTFDLTEMKAFISDVRSGRYDP